MSKMSIEKVIAIISDANIPHTVAEIDEAYEITIRILKEQILAKSVCPCDNTIILRVDNSEYLYCLDCGQKIKVKGNKCINCTNYEGGQYVYRGFCHHCNLSVKDDYCCNNFEEDEIE